MGEAAFREAIMMAGYITAHAVLSVSEGETLIPIYAYVNDEDALVMERMPQYFLEEAVVAGQDLLNQNPKGTWAAILVYDGRIGINEDGSKKADALITELRVYTEEYLPLVFALTYRPKAPFVEFGVYRLERIQHPDSPFTGDVKPVVESFYDGAERHQKAWEVWSKHQLVLPVNDDVGIYDQAVTQRQFSSWQSMALQSEPISMGYKYDDAEWHSGSDFPDELPPEAGATHIGMFLVWCVLNGLGDESFIEPDMIADLKARKVTPGAWVLEFMDGKLTNDPLSDRANSFAYRYYNSTQESEHNYNIDYADTMPVGESIYHVQDTWENYDRLAPLLEKRYQEWAASNPDL